MKNNKNIVVEKSTKTKIHSFKKVSKFLVFVYKHFKFIIFLEILFVFFIAYLFIIRIELSEIKKYHELMTFKSQELEKVKNYQKVSFELESQYKSIEQELQQDINKLYSILPPKDDLPNLLVQIASLVEAHGFSLGSIDMSSEQSVNLDEKKVPILNSENNQEEKLIKEVNVNLFIFTNNGGYQRIKELLTAFEHHIRFMDIVSFGFEKDMKTYSIILKTYYLDYEK